MRVVSNTQITWGVIIIGEVRELSANQWGKKIDNSPELLRLRKEADTSL